MNNNEKEKELDYAVANTLYLMSEVLGEDYERVRKSPFAEDFEMSEDLVDLLIKNGKEKEKVTAPSFLENGNKEVAESFKKSLNVTLVMLEQLESLVLNEKDENVKRELVNLVIVLRARKKLIEIAMEKLKDVNANSYALFVELVGLGKRIQEMFENSYEEEIKKEELLNSLLEYAKRQAKMKALAAAQIKEVQTEVEERIAKQEQKIEQEIKQEIERKSEEQKISAKKKVVSEAKKIEEIKQDTTKDQSDLGLNN